MSIPANFNGLQKISEYIKFVEWCALPEPWRVPKYQNDLALELGVAEATLSDWKKREGFYDLIKEETKKWGKNRTSNVIGSLYRKAVNDGNAQEAKLWLQYIEDWREKSELETKNANINYILTRETSEKEDRLIQEAEYSVAKEDN